MITNNLTIKFLKTVYNPNFRFGCEKTTSQISIVDRDCLYDTETVINNGELFLFELIEHQINNCVEDVIYKLRFVDTECFNLGFYEYMDLLTNHTCPNLEYKKATNTLYYELNGFTFKIYNFGIYNITDLVLELQPGISNHPDSGIRHVVNYIMRNREKGYQVIGLGEN